MNFRSGKIKDFYLLTTEVENIFINEYMPQTPGDFVKVYLYALMYAERGIEMTHEALANQLGLSLGTVDDAWNYWANMGVVKKLYTAEKESDAARALSLRGELAYDIEFVSLRELMYGSMNETEQRISQAQPEASADRDSSLFDEGLRELFDCLEELKGKPISTKEMQEISSWQTMFDMDVSLIMKAMEHCYSKNKTQIKYIGAVIREWYEKGIKTAEEADEYLETAALRYGDYKRILSSLGIVGRVATDGEKKLIDKWMDEMGFTAERILEACQKTLGIQNPNVNYVNKILENWQKEATSFGRDVNKKTTVSRADLNNYYDFLRQEAKRKAEERKAEVYEKLPRIEEIDESLKELGSRLSRAVLGGSAKQDLEEIKRLTALLEQERAVILTESNLPLDFTDVKPLCDICQDTGIDEAGRRCACVKERIGEAELWLKSKRK